MSRRGSVALCTLKPKKPLKTYKKNLKTLKKIPKNLGFFQPWKRPLKRAKRPVTIQSGF